MQNLNDQEILAWKLRCLKQREAARNAPCFHPAHALLEQFGFQLGPWNCRFTLDRFVKPASWHGTVSLFKEIGTEPVMDAEGRYLFDTPQDALLAVHAWDVEEMDIARDLLGDIFGELIGRDTIVRVNKGIFALHWMAQCLDN